MVQYFYASLVVYDFIEKGRLYLGQVLVTEPETYDQIIFV